MKIKTVKVIAQKLYNIFLKLSLKVPYQCLFRKIQFKRQVTVLV